MNIDVIKKRLILKYPLFGSTISKCEFVADFAIETAATDGKKIYYNPDFVNSIDKDTQLFLFAHEVCHIVFKHFIRGKDKNIQVWNYATDAVINAYLQKDGLPIIEGGINYPEAIKYDAEELYEKMINDKNNGKNNQDNHGGQDNQSNQKSHGNQGEQNNQKSDKNRENNGDNPGSKDCKDQKSFGNLGHDDHSRWVNKENEKSSKDIDSSLGEDQKISEKDIFKENSDEKRNNLERMKKEMISNSLKGMSNVSQNRKVDFNNIEKSINWRVLLKESITNNQDWSYRNATIEDGVVIPNLEDSILSETEILLDTSSSIRSVMLSNFVAECLGIIADSKIKIGCFDTEFYGFTEIRDEEDIKNLEFKGGGGTDFDCAVNAFTPHATNRIIFTDGMAKMPDKYVDAIWCVFGGQKIHPPGGKVFYLDKKDLEQKRGYSK